MKIGVLHGFVGGGGGTEKTLVAILEALIEKKYEVSLYAFSKPTIPIPKEIVVHSTIPFSFPYLGIYQRYMESKLIQKTKNDSIIIQASGGISLPENKNQKLVIYCHNDFQSESKKPITKYKGIWRIYYKPYYQSTKKFLKNILNSNIHLISNSRFVQESIKNKFGKDSLIINPPVNLIKFRNNFEKHDQVITISRYSQEKNLTFAIQVMKDIDITYSIIGNTKTKSNIVFYERLRTMAQDNSKIKLLKNITRDDLIEKLQRSKIYFHASPETFGITVIESIAAGCIPIVPDNSAHVETVPIPELRYKINDEQDARTKIKSALDGKYDNYLEKLQDHICKYDKTQFKKSFINFIEKLKN